MTIAAKYVLNVSDDGVMAHVDFAAHRKDKSPCNHRNITFTQLDSELTCLDCGAKINPVAWIATFATQLYRGAKDASQNQTKKHVELSLT